MVDYTREEQLNELARLFRGRVDPARQNGLIDPISIHSQIIEIAKTVFLLNPGALFYLARLVRNSLLVLVRREQLIVEDMLVALDHLSNAQRNDGTIGAVSATDLSNAQTALLSLEFANSVVDRPELARFQKIMDRFAVRYRANMVDPRGNAVLPRGEARAVLRTNLTTLRSLHPQILALLDNLVGLVDEYNALDIPSQVSQTTIVNTREQLASLQQAILDSQEEELITDSRLIVLRALASKVVVALLAQFTVPSLASPALTSDNTGLGADPNSGAGPFLAQAAGEGTAAFVETVAGPWRLDDLDSGTIELVVDGGTPQVIDISVVQGPGLHGRNSAPFTDDQLYPTYPGPPNNLPPFGGGPSDPPPPPVQDFRPKPNLHFFVDKTPYEFTATEFGYVDRFNTFFGPVGGDNDPPAPDNNAPPSDLADSVLSSTQPRTYPAEGSIANVTGIPGELISDYYNAVKMTPARKLGFKHLGTPIFFSLGEVPAGTPEPAQVGAGFGGWNVDGQDTLEDAGEWENIEDRRWDYLFRPRSIFDLTFLTDITISHVSGNTYSGAPGTFLPGWVGFYVRVGGDDPAQWERYEITKVNVDGSQAEIDTRGDAPGAAAGTVDVFGTRGDYTMLTFSPDLLADTSDVADLTGSPHRTPASIPSTCTVKISPAIKTARVLAGSGADIATTISDLNNPANGDYDYPDNRYQHASYHCVFKEQTGFNGRVTVQARTRFVPDDDHLLQVAGGFFQLDMYLPPFGAGTGALTGQNGLSGSVVAGALLPSAVRLQLPGGTFGLENIYNYIELSNVGDPGNSGTFLILLAGTASGLPTDEHVDVLNFNAVAPDPNNGSIIWAEYAKGAGHRFTIPGPNPQRLVQDSGHEVFGFDVGQQIDSSLDVFLSPEELLAVLEDQIDSSTTAVELVEEDVITGTINVVPGTYTLQDLSLDFSDIGTQLGYQIELRNGNNAGVYFVESAAGNTLQVARPPAKSEFGFVGKETGIPYRLFKQTVRISSANSGPNSSVQVTSAPSQLGLPSALITGVAPAIEAVDGDGNKLDLSGLSAGDKSGSLVVESVSADGTQAAISGGVVSTLTGLRFSFSSATVDLLSQVLGELEEIRDARDLLARFNFDQNLDKLDADLSALVTPGQAFLSNVNQVRTLLSHLLGVLTKTPPNPSLYSAQIPAYRLAIDDSASAYQAAAVEALDVLLDALNEHSFDRALSLLLTGQLQEFFNTTPSTASFAGNLLAATQDVAADIPGNSPLQADVEEDTLTASSVEVDIDADEDFSDANETLDTL